MPKTKESSTQNYFSIILLLIPIAMILIFSFSILLDGTPEFKVDKTQHGLKVGKIHGKLNPVQSGDLINKIHGLEYYQIRSLAISPSTSAGKEKTISLLRNRKLITMIPKINPVSPFRLLSEAWPHFISYQMPLGNAFYILARPLKLLCLPTRLNVTSQISGFIRFIWLVGFDRADSLLV